VSLPATLPEKFDASVPLGDPRYERFAQLRVMGVPKIEAAWDAGFRKEGTEDKPILPGNVARLDRHPEIIARKAYLAKDDDDVIAATRLAVRDRLLASATMNVLADFAIIGHVEIDGKKVPRIVGIDWKALKNSEHAAAITGFKFDRESGVMTEFTRDDPLQALSQIRDMYGFRAPRKTELTGKAGGPVMVVDPTKLSYDQLVQLESLLAAAAGGEHVDIGAGGDREAPGAPESGTRGNGEHPSLDLPSNGR
jgi:hypothetical protein